MGTTVFLETGPARGHRYAVGGLSVLERRIREVARAGADRVIIATEPLLFPRPLPIRIEFVRVGTPPPPDVRRERADVIAGVEIVDRATRNEAEWKLIRGMNKSFEGPIDALVNWRFSMRLTRLLARASLRLTPNHVTLVAIAVGLAAAALVATGDRIALALGGVLLQVNSILDSCDGELARLRFQYSRLGQWLDNLSDDIVDNLFIAACGLYLGGAWLTVAAAAAAGRVLHSLAIYVAVYRKTGTGDVFAFRYFWETDKATADAVYDRRSLLTWIRALGRRDTFVFAWMIACFAGFPQWVVGHGLAIAVANLGVLSVHAIVVALRR